MAVLVGVSTGFHRHRRLWQQRNQGTEAVQFKGKPVVLFFYPLISPSSARPS